MTKEITKDNNNKHQTTLISKFKNHFNDSIIYFAEGYDSMKDAGCRITKICSPEQLKSSTVQEFLQDTGNIIYSTGKFIICFAVGTFKAIDLARNSYNVATTLLISSDKLLASGDMLQQGFSEISGIELGGDLAKTIVDGYNGTKALSVAYYALHDNSDVVNISGESADINIANEAGVI
jgi:hypothetical protein